MLKSYLKFLTLLFIVYHLTPSVLFAQDEIKSPLNFSIDYRKGKTKSFYRYIDPDTTPYSGIDLKLGWQTIGKQAWQVAYRYPNYGVGLNWCTYSTDKIGKPVATYFYTNFPQIRTQWFRIDFDVDFGLSYSLTKIDALKPSDYYVPESKVKFFFGFHFEESIHLSQHLDIFACQGLTHYSNGALSYPNIGIDIFSYKFGLRYQPKVVKRLDKIPIPKIEKHWQLSTYFGTGTKILYTPTPYYTEFLISPSIQYKASFKHRVGVGIEIAYNETFRGLHPDIDYKTKDLLTYAVAANHDFMIDRFTILTQFGFYLHNQPRDKIYFERLGFSYYVFPSTRIVFNIKAHFLTAEYLETGLIFDLNLK